MMDLKFCLVWIVILFPFVKTLNGFEEARVVIFELGDCFTCPCIKQVMQKSVETRIAFRINGFIIELKLELIIVPVATGITVSKGQ